ncbi:MAG: SGNH/GDSL hydrolase family protein, partial [Ignavibacteriales bacterium]|nr:SGNH/GDSL hydrolase family protein [Ignavibacteriales bacterium]
MFTIDTIGGKPYYLFDPSVKNRYFSYVSFSPNTALDCFPAIKSKGTVRIFCMGGSTTVGFPYGPVGSFSTFLRDRLKASYPTLHFEVVNLGMTATNSFTVLDLAQELLRYEPDLLVVYDGHNEFYGALGIASRESLGQSRLLTLLNLKLIRFRTFQLLRLVFTSSVRSVQPGTSSPESGTLMERLARDQHIPYKGKVFNDALSIFRSNLIDLVSLTQTYSIPLVLCTQASNVRDLEPFVSTPMPELSDIQRAEFDRLFDAGRKYRDSHQLDSALAFFNTAVIIDSNRADIRFAIAQCLDSLHRYVPALDHYVR